MDPIKEAFSKIKEEMSSLRQDISYLRESILELYSFQTQKGSDLGSLRREESKPTDKQTEKSHLGGLKGQNMDVSTGNKGVPTDRLTDQQTDNKGRNTLSFPMEKDLKENFGSFTKAREALESLDSIKRQIRLQFKRLTPKEMLVFSALYALQEQNIDEITYKLLSENLSLSESSIRDYVIKLVQKGVPIHKTKVNNKTVLLSIDPDLTKIASLDTIMRLREL